MFQLEKNLFFNQETHARCTQHHGRHRTIDVDDDDATTLVAIVMVEVVVLTLMLINANADMDGMMREKGSQVSQCQHYITSLHVTVTSVF